MLIGLGLGLASWVFWAVWVGLFLAWEIPAVFLEKKTGMLPLTRVVRDRLMKRYAIVKYGVLFLIAYLFAHFIINTKGW